MTTTIDLPDDVLRKAMKIAGTNSPQEAVIQALNEFAQQHDQSHLVKLLGTFEDFMTPEELQEMREAD